MTAASSISDLVKEHMSEMTNRLLGRHCGLFVCREDGVLIFFEKGRNKMSLERDAIGALVGGVWQAARELSRFIPNHSDEKGYRLSFDTSSEGLTIYPISVAGENYYLGCIFDNELSPGLIKNKLKRMAIHLEESLEDIKIVEEKEAYLFENITDDEMDDLFSGIQQ